MRKICLIDLTVFSSPTPTAQYHVWILQHRPQTLLNLFTGILLTFLHDCHVFLPKTFFNPTVDLLTTLDWLVKMAYWSSYDTTENSSSDVQWTVIVSYEAVHNSSRIAGGSGAEIGKTKDKCLLKDYNRSRLDFIQLNSKQKISQSGTKHHPSVLFCILTKSVKIGCSSSICRRYNPMLR